MPTRQPAVLTLIINRIDHMETSVTNSIEQMQGHLSQRIDDLTERVKVQNSRIAKCEDKIGGQDRIIAATQLESRPWDKKRVAFVGGGGLISGAALVEVLKWLAGTWGKGGI